MGQRGGRLYDYDRLRRPVMDAAEEAAQRHVLRPHHTGVHHDRGPRPADLYDTVAHGALLRGERVPGRAPSPVPASQRDPDSAVAPAPRVPGDGPLPA